MPITTNDDDEEGWLSVLLALRLRQIEAKYSGLKELAQVIGLSRGTLYQLRTGKGNPTIVTVERIARQLNMSVWDLLGRSSDEDQVRDDLNKNGLSYDDISQHIEATKAARKSFLHLYGDNSKTPGKSPKPPVEAKPGPSSKPRAPKKR
ncbi:helix-turn-helix domain-containing protein [Phreatobacter sp. AB_2022a]|uniref:helix-turn-helix domain-containing protein n=1 Tax=Phreatobacter sp. AB_2022a TaxID=3003134 RepID=UPI002287519C|nr:helix-turn-helix transcriptional regulator [Phreatobacter sp. AB_2022a]MCZ0738170.1 helix-turn-helix transcriptional regulator [Phreatobacter sp. AB_2022a]